MYNEYRNNFNLIFRITSSEFKKKNEISGSKLIRAGIEIEISYGLELMRNVKAVERFVSLANSTKLDWLRWHRYKKYFKTRDEREQICDSHALFHDRGFSTFIIRK